MKSLESQITAARELVLLNYTQKFIFWSRFGITADSASSSTLPPQQQPQPQQKQQQQQQRRDRWTTTFYSRKVFPRRWRSSNRAATPAIYRYPWRRFIGDIRPLFHPGILDNSPGLANPACSCSSLLSYTEMDKKRTMIASQAYFVGNLSLMAKLGHCDSTDITRYNPRSSQSGFPQILTRLTDKRVVGKDENGRPERTASHHRSAATP